jgi:hypothetical protein
MHTTETHYPVQSVASTSEPTKQLLADIAETFGSIPSILGVMANSPIAIQSYQRLSVLFSLSDFTPLEVHGIYLTMIREEGNADLASEHISLLNGWFNVPESVTEAIVSGTPTGKDKLDVLLKTVRQLIQNQGALSIQSRKDFIRAGYDESQLIDLLVPVAMKTMTGYLERLNQTEN